MKKTIRYILLMLPLVAGLMACSNEVEESSGYAKGMGGLNLKTGLSTQITIPVITKSADFSDLDVYDFYIQITNTENGTQVFDDTYSALIDNGLPLVLPLGNYSITASSRKVADTGVSKIPYFMDQQYFVIEENRTTNLDMKCTFESLGVELVISDQFKQKLEEQPHNYTYEVSVSNGKESCTFDPDQMDPMYFREACDELVVKVNVRLGSSNSWYPERTYRVKNGDNAPVLGEYYIIRLDAGEEEETYSLETVSLTDKQNEI